VPTVFTHAAFALALGAVLHPPNAPARFWVLGAAGAVIPDLDVFGLGFGVPYEDALGHRGFTHSLVFSGLVAAVVTALAFRGDAWKGQRARLWWYFALAAASHGLLDMLTDGGGGVALFWPMDVARRFFPWRPVEVSPIGLERFLSERGLTVLLSELRWIWAPAAMLVAASWVWRRRTASSA
jgi:inner membrane protein